MEGISFQLSGYGAMFTRPHINTANGTYSHIHKIALLGLFGSMLGLSGHREYYNQVAELKKKRTKELPLTAFPEFYQELQGLKMAIVPNSPKFPKNRDHIINGTGFYNDGYAIQLSEEYLIEPSWRIIVMQGEVRGELYQTLKETILKGDSHYRMYLGRNEYPASISEAKIVELEKPVEVYEVAGVMPKKQVEILPSLDIEKKTYLHVEYMPIKYRPYVNNYIEEELCWTNEEIFCEDVERPPFYQLGDQIMYFL